MIDDFSEGIKIIDGVNFKINHQRMTFLLLIKSIERDNSKTINIMLADSSDNFWLGDFDEPQIKKIKGSMKLTGTYKEFFITMKEMLKQKSYEIEIGVDLSIDLVIEFNFSGIILNSRFKIGKPFKRDDNPTISYNLLKVFVLDLYNACEKEKHVIETQNTEFKEYADNINKQIQEGQLIKSSNQPNQAGQNSQDKSSNIKKVKPNTCMINPQRRKRKAMGAKIGSQPEDD